MSVKKLNKKEITRTTMFIIIKYPANIHKPKRVIFNTYAPPFIILINQLIRINIFVEL